MKILQVTHFGTTTNYGAVLQAFALQKALRSVGHDPVLLKADFSYYKKIRRWYRNPNIALKAWLRKKKEEQEEIRHPRHFAQFIQNFMSATEKTYHAITELQKESWNQFDAMVTGSDQVWSDKLPSDLYFLNFGPPQAIRFSYAASVGTKAHSSPEYCQAFQHAVQSFSAVSVREHNALELCRKAGVSAVLVPDPVLLFSPQDYESFFHLPQKTGNTKTCLIYLVGKNNLSSMKEISDFCAAHQLTPVSVNSQYHTSGQPVESTVIYPDIPGWLQQIRDAELVITDSFHGTVFALLFGKRIVIFPKKDYDARFEMLDRCFGTGQAVCRGNFAETVNSPLDYPAIQKKIEEFRKQGWLFLSQTLN